MSYLSQILMTAVFLGSAVFHAFLYSLYFLVKLDILTRIVEAKINSFNTWKWVSLSC